MSGPAFEISHGPSFALLRVDLMTGQSVTAEAGALVARRGELDMRVALNTGPRAGLWARLWALCVALVRKAVGAETLFVTRHEARSGGSVWLAPPMSGAIAHRTLAGDSIVLAGGNYLASSGEVELKLRFVGWRGLLSRSGLFWIEARGNGELWFTSYGGIEAIEVDGSFIVDNGHLVAYEGRLEVSVRRAARGFLGFVASGEGMVCRFEGKGRVHVQARNVGRVNGWLEPFLS